MKPALNAILAGEPDSLRILSSSGTAWQPLIDYLLHTESAAPGPEFARAMWELVPDLRKWRSLVASSLSESESPIHSRARVVHAWLRLSVCAAFPPSHPAAIDAKFDELRSVPGDDGGYSEAKALYDVLHTLGNPRVGEAAMLAFSGANTVGDYVGAERYATAAYEYFARSENSKSLQASLRARACALLGQRRWHEAFVLLDDVLNRNDPKRLLFQLFEFLDGGTSVMRAGLQGKDLAVDEACAVAQWATAVTPEWIRVLGSLAEQFRDDAFATQFEARFRSSLAELAKQENSIDDFDTVIRQLRERSHDMARRIAIECAIQAHPEDSLLRSMLGNILSKQREHTRAAEQLKRAAEILDLQQSPDTALAWSSAARSMYLAGDDAPAQLAFARAEASARGPAQQHTILLYRAQSREERDPALALSLARELFERIRTQPKLFAESPIGEGVVDLLNSLLLRDKNPEVLWIQQTLLDAKHAHWGECPAVSLERYRLGTLHAQLGNLQQARAWIARAHQSLLEQLGPQAPSVEMCAQSLSRLPSSSADV